MATNNDNYDDLEDVLSKVPPPTQAARRLEWERRFDEKVKAPPAFRPAEMEGENDVKDFWDGTRAKAPRGVELPRFRGG